MAASSNDIHQYAGAGERVDPPGSRVGNSYSNLCVEAYTFKPLTFDMKFNIDTFICKSWKFGSKFYICQALDLLKCLTYQSHCCLMFSLNDQILS